MADVDNNNNKKSVIVAYFCWLVGGVFGLHLFYLRRDAHAFIRWSTFGGFGVGWILDFKQIPRYVKDCNDDPNFLAELGERMRQHEKPPFSMDRFTTSVAVGCFWGGLVDMAVPHKEVLGINWNMFHWLIPLAVALGVWVVGNIGRQQGGPWTAIGISYLAYDCGRWYWAAPSIWTVAVLTHWGFNTYSKQWRRAPRKKHSFIRRVATLTLCGMLYLSLWISYLRFNVLVRDLYTGEKITIYDAYQRRHPWRHESGFRFAYDGQKVPEGRILTAEEVNAYKILDVDPNWPNKSEITSKWRALSLKWHPDKIKAQLKVAQRKFMEIQRAYEIVSEIERQLRRQRKKYMSAGNGWTMNS